MMQRRLKTENFKTFDSYILLPEDRTIKRWIDQFGFLKLKQKQFYCKFSNKEILDTFLILLAKQLKLQSQSSLSNIVLRNQKEDDQKNKELTVNIVRSIHQKFIHDVANYKSQYMALDIAEIESVLSNLQENNRLSFRIVDQYTETKKQKEIQAQKVELVVFNLPNYYILGIFEKPQVIKVVFHLLQFIVSIILLTYQTILGVNQND